MMTMAMSGQVTQCLVHPLISRENQLASHLQDFISLRRTKDIMRFASLRIVKPYLYTILEEMTRKIIRTH